MQRPTSKIAAIAVPLMLGAAIAGNATAADLCTVAEPDRQPIEALQSKLEGEGWEVKNIKVDEGCYEAYAINAQGERVENYYDPQTFELVKAM